AGEPDDGSDADHARPVVVPVEAGRGDRGCCCGHGLIMSVRSRRATPPPWVLRSRSSQRGTAPTLGTVVVLSEAGSLADLAPFTFHRVFTAWWIAPATAVGAEEGVH